MLWLSKLLTLLQGYRIEIGHNVRVVVATRIAHGASDGTIQKKYARGGTSPERSALELERLLSIVVTNLIKSYHRIFKWEQVAPGDVVDREVFEKMSGDSSANLKIVLKNYKLCLKMRLSGHF